MGIRIHKMCGYGLTDVVEDDPRIDWDSPVFSYKLNSRDHVDRYLNFCDKFLDYNFERRMIESKLKEGRVRINLQDCVEHGTSDGGLRNVLCLRPLGALDWYRYDDTLDWVEEAYIHSPGAGMVDRVQTLPHGIFPYSGNYMDSRTGARLGPEVMDWIRLWTNMSESAKETARDSDKVLEELDKLCSAFGMNQYEAEHYIAPTIPDEVKAVAMYTEVFKSDTTCLELRPMIYTWWA